MDSSDISDTFREEATVLPPDFITYGGITACHGEIVTMLSPGNVPGIINVLAIPGEGRILVVDSGDIGHFALFGGRMAAIAITSGWRAILVNSYIRDAATLQNMEFGVWAKGTCPQRMWTEPEVVMDPLLRFGNAELKTGNYIYLDADGGVVAKEPLHHRKTEIYQPDY